MRLSRRTCLLILVALGLLLVGVEVRFLHREVLAEYPQAVIPIVFGVLGALSCLMALAPVRGVQIGAAILLGLGVPVGLVGVFNHTEGNLASITRVLTAQVIVARASEGESEEHEGEGEETEEEAPALAPLGLAGLGLIGAVVAWPERRKPVA